MQYLFSNRIRIYESKLTHKSFIKHEILLEVWTILLNLRQLRDASFFSLSLSLSLSHKLTIRWNHDKRIVKVWARLTGVPAVAAGTAGQ